MADQEDPLADDVDEEVDVDEEDFDEEDLDEDLVDAEVVVDDDDLVADVVAEDELVEVPLADLAEGAVDAAEADAVVDAPPRRSDRPATTDDEEEDEDVVDPDDVEEDLDTILRDRIAAGTEDEPEDEETAADGRTETGDRVSPRRPEEVSCPECFLLVRRSQFSTKRADCPGGLDAADCPMVKMFVGTG